MLNRARARGKRDWCRRVGLILGLLAMHQPFYAMAVNAALQQQQQQHHGSPAIGPASGSNHNACNGGIGGGGNNSGGHIKEPKNAHSLWSRAHRRKIVLENPDVHYQEVSKRLGAAGKQLNEDDKRPFIDEAKRLREQHKRDYPYCKQPRSKPKPPTSKKSDQPYGMPAGAYYVTDSHSAYLHHHKGMAFFHDAFNTAETADAAPRENVWSVMPDRQPQQSSPHCFSSSPAPPDTYSPCLPEMKPYKAEPYEELWDPMQAFFHDAFNTAETADAAPWENVWSVMPDQQPQQSSPHCFSSSPAPPDTYSPCLPEMKPYKAEPYEELWDPMQAFFHDAFNTAETADAAPWENVWSVMPDQQPQQSSPHCFSSGPAPPGTYSPCLPEVKPYEAGPYEELWDLMQAFFHDAFNTAETADAAPWENVWSVTPDQQPQQSSAHCFSSSPAPPGTYSPCLPEVKPYEELWDPVHSGPGSLFSEVYGVYQSSVLTSTVVSTGYPDAAAATATAYTYGGGPGYTIE
ncbi:uncharacterized protein LOC142576147 [Dermacentor variabilis]|uniref:uncharacterized protein LOC142576147 n=1 Tax=Dermacentor variabilis TaxID=34621 RepID=UPI003F5C5363